MSVPIQNRPETELVLLCAAPVKTEGYTARIRELLELDLDWAFVSTFADWHRFAPILYWELNAIQPGIVPPWLTEKFERNTRSNLFLTGELFRLIDLFESENIPAIPFKGPTLAQRAYGNLALRSFDDLDILLRPQDVWRARDAMLRLGYREKVRLNPDREASILGSYDEITLYREGGYPLVELHWAFVPPHFFVSPDLAGMWRRQLPVVVGNRALPSLADDDLVFVLALHGAKHCWSHFGLISDFAWLIASQTISWDTVLDRAREQGIHRIVLLAAVLAARLFRMPVADRVQRGVETDPAVTKLAAEIVETVFGEGYDEQAIVSTGLLHIKMRERLRDRLRYWLRLAARPGIEDWQMIDLPGPLRVFYPLLRFPRLVFKYRTRVP